MLELAPAAVSIATCAAEPLACDSVARVPDAVSCRVAPDEVMLVGAPEAAERLVAVAIDRSRPTDADTVVIDATEGWAAFALIGDSLREAFSRLSALPLPDEGFLQGDVARVPVKVIARPDRLVLLVPSIWREHLRERILERCRTLAVVERSDPIEWTDREAQPR